MKILAVEDSGSFETIYELCGLDGHQVARAFTGSDAIAFLMKDTFDVVLLDMGLPRGEMAMFEGKNVLEVGLTVKEQIIKKEISDGFYNKTLERQPYLIIITARGADLAGFLGDEEIEKVLEKVIKYDRLREVLDSIIEREKQDIRRLILSGEAKHIEDVRPKEKKMATETEFIVQALFDICNLYSSIDADKIVVFHSFLFQAAGSDKPNIINTIIDIIARLFWKFPQKEREEAFVLLTDIAQRKLPLAVRKAAAGICKIFYPELDSEMQRIVKDRMQAIANFKLTD